MVLPVIGEKTAGKVYKMLQHYTVEELQEEYNKLSGMRRRTRDPAVLQEVASHLQDVNLELQHRLTTMQADRLMGEHETGEMQTAQLGDLARIGSPLYDADFWLQRRGDRNTVGKLRDDTWAKYDIGVKMKPEYAHLLPLVRSYMYRLHSQGYWGQYAVGTLTLQHIRTFDVRDVELEIPATATKTAAQISVTDQAGTETAIPFREVQPGDTVRFLEPFGGVAEGETGTVIEIREGGPDMLVWAPAQQELDDGRHVTSDAELLVPVNHCVLILHPDDERI
jgi:hypothetical protein